MSRWVLTLNRNWAQPPDSEPIIEFLVHEYEESDGNGYVGCIEVVIQMNSGMCLHKQLKLTSNQFKFFVSEISERYGQGGPK